MTMSFASRLFGAVVPALLLIAAEGRPASAAYIFASGQLLIENEPGTHDDVRENAIFRIDTLTGAATRYSQIASGLPSALAASQDGRLLGLSGGRLSEVDIETGAVTPIGPNTGLNSTSLDIRDDGAGFLLPFVGGRTDQLHAIDVATGLAQAIGSPTAIGDALDAAFGLAPGTASPFIIGLGSVGTTLYGVNLEAGRTNLIAIDGATGAASVVGGLNALGAGAFAAYSGYAGMTGVDEDGDGLYDAIFGAVNFFDHDGLSSTPTLRLGGVARYDLTTGTFSLVGTNPGLIYFGFASSPTLVPEPSAVVSLGAGLALLGLAARRARARHGRPELSHENPFA